MKGKSGSAAKTCKKYIFSEQLSFLKSTLVTRETESSFDVDNNPESLDNERRENDDSWITEGPSTSAATDKKNPNGTAETTTKQPSSTMAPKVAPKRKKIDLEREILDELSKKEDRHLSFFKGVLPSLKDFSEDETLQFQSFVVNAIQDIKRNRTGKSSILLSQTSDAHFRSQQAPVPCQTNFSNWSHLSSRPHTLTSQAPNMLQNVQLASTYNNVINKSQPATQQTLLSLNAQSPDPSVYSDISEESSILDISFSHSSVNHI